MSLTQADRSEFNLLLDLTAAEVIDESQRARLNTFLRTSNDAERLYLEYFGLHAALGFYSAVQPLQTSAATVPFASPATSLVTPLSNDRRTIVWLSSRSVSWLAAAVVLALVFWGVVAVWVFPQLHRATTVDIAKNGPPEVGRFVSGKGCQWIGSQHPQMPGTILRLGELNLAVGTAELELTSGVRIVIEGPTRFDVQAIGRSYLQQGKLVAHVPKQAIGYTIATPMATIVDLGTDFGIEANATGQTNVEVFQGKVDVTYSPGTRSAQSLRRTVRMSAGQAKQFSKRAGAAEVSVVDVSPDMKNRLAKSSPATAPNESQPDAASRRYAAAVLADRPLGYWRLSDGHREVATDASGNGLIGRYCGSIRTAQPGLFDGATDGGVRLLGPNAPGWIEIDNVELPASFSFEAWVRSATPEWDVNEWFASGRIPQGFIMGPGNNRAWRFLLVKDDIQAGYTVGWHAPEKIDDRFHHYVGTYDVATDRGCMYFDGVLVEQSQPLIGENRVYEPRKLTLHVGRDPYTGARTCGHGWLDEVAIYPRALTSEAVRQHYQVSGYASTTESAP